MILLVFVLIFAIAEFKVSQGLALDFCDRSAAHAQGSSLMILSPSKIDVDNASSICESYEMHLAHVEAVKVQSPLSRAMHLKYIQDKDIVRFWVRYLGPNPNIHRYDLGLFVPDQAVWKSTASLGHLNYVDLYRRNATGRIGITICLETNSGEGLVLFEGTCPPHQFWRNQGMVFAESAYKPGLKQFYVYHNTVANCHKIREVNETFLNFTKFVSTFFAPVINAPVYVGATYNKQNGRWLGDWWEPNNLPPPADERCQQLALQYRNGWQARATCAKQAHFMCEMKFQPKVRVQPLRPSDIEITWDNTLSILVDKLSRFPLASVTVEVGKTNNKLQKAVILKVASSLTFENLQSDCHFVKVTALLAGCRDISLTSNLRIATGNRIPGKIRSASVLNSTTSCYIEITTPAYVEEYYILASSDVNQTLHVFNANNLTNNRFKIDTAPHGSRNDVSFSIKYFYCGHYSDEYSVKGSCLSSEIPNRDPLGFDITSVEGIVVVSSACVGFLFVVLSVITLTFLFLRRRNKANKKVTKPEDSVRYEEKVVEIKEEEKDQDLSSTSNTDDMYDIPDENRKVLALHDDMVYENQSAFHIPYYT